MSISGRHWLGVRLRTVEIGSDPDAPARRLAIPAAWDDQAAAGLAGLCGDGAPGWAPVRLPDAAAAWIERLVAAGRRSGAVVDPDGFGDALHAMLLRRRGCIDEGGWRAEAQGSRGFVLNLAAFVDGECGFDEAALSRAAAVAGRAAALGGGAAVRVADLDGMLARLGIEYDSAEARTAARAVIELVRAGAGTASVGVSVGPAGWVDALLGVETAGLAPAFSPVAEDGRLTAATVARLAALDLSPERALAMTLADAVPPLAVAGASAHAAMHDSLAPLLVSAGERPACAPRLAAAAPAAPNSSRRALPARSKGFTQKVTIGGHRLFLRTAEYGDGALGEIAVTPGGRDGGMSRGLAEAWASAVSIGLQHGVPLGAFVDAFTHARFGTGGAVEGDPSILAASSPLDYVVRALADAYLGRHLPDPAPDETASEPLLPLGFRGGAEAQAGQGASGMRQRALRLVSPA